MDLIDFIGTAIGLTVAGILIVRWMVSRFVQKGMEQAAKEDLKEWD